MYPDVLESVTECDNVSVAGNECGIICPMVHSISFCSWFASGCLLKFNSCLARFESRGITFFSLVKPHDDFDCFDCRFYYVSKFTCTMCIGKAEIIKIFLNLTFFIFILSLSGNKYVLPSVNFVRPFVFVGITSRIAGNMSDPLDSTWVFNRKIQLSQPTVWMMWCTWILDGFWQGPI